MNRLKSYWVKLIIKKSAREIEIMREGGRIVAEAFELLEEAVAPGVTTEKLNQIAEKYILKRRATPLFKGYRGFPKSICSSINEEVVHGIPDNRRLKEGDIVSIDLGVLYQGYCGDAAKTFPIGEISEEAAKLLEIAKKALNNGISQAYIGNKLSDISYTIQKTVEEAGYSVVREYVGHGIGKEMHEDPPVPNYGSPGQGPQLEEGFTLAIEPMVNIGGYEVETKEDGWTVVTRDRKLSAHFEHTVAITNDDSIILTKI